MKLSRHTGRYKKVAALMARNPKIKMTPRRRAKLKADAAKVNRQRSFI